MSHFKRSRTVALLVLPVWLLMNGALGATPGENSMPDSSDVSTQVTPITIYTNQTSAFRAGGEAERLIQRAIDQGEIRVMVGLNITMRMEHTLSDYELNAQRSDLEQMQNVLIERVFGSVDAAGVDKFTFIPFVSMFVNAEQLKVLLADSDVVTVREDIPQPPLLHQSTPLIHANNVWAKGFNGTGQVVAILDTGVAHTGSEKNAMVAGRVVSDACFSTKNAAGTIRSFCPGNATSSTAYGSGIHCPIAINGCDHGTHVASIAAGNSSLLDGVARDARIIAIQVFSRFNTAALCNPRPAPCIKSYGNDQLRALQRVYNLRGKYKIAAVNMSIGGGLFDAVCDDPADGRVLAIKNLREAGIATIIASGNNGSTGKISKPACISHAIAIGNTQKDDLVARSSNHNNLIKLMAPGTNIKAGIPGSPGDKYASKSGTSMAAPHVAGAFALLKNAKPKATIDQMMEALTCSGKTVDYRKTATGVVELNPAKPRIDLLGAYNFLRKPPDVRRTWTFDAALQARDWTPFNGKWAISSGNYIQTPFKSGWTGSSAANCNTALNVIAKVRRIDPSTDLHYNSGIFIKTSLDYRAETVSGYWMAYNKAKKNPSDPESKPGQGVIWRVHGLNFETGAASSSALLCYAYVPINVGGYNKIKVVSNGTTHAFYLNDKLVCSAGDSTFASGPVMVASAAPRASGHSFRIDSLSTQTIGVNSTEIPASMEATIMNPAKMPPITSYIGISPMGVRSP